MASLIRNLGLLLICVSLSVAVKVKILHTTDIHGWVDGHSHNNTLNADFGDFHSLLLHMHANAINNGEELFLFDTGDLIEGTGMSDATAVHGQYIFDIIMNISTYTAMTMGNHDIGHPEVVNLMRNSFIPFWNGSYLTANSEMEPGSKLIANPYTVFTTALGTTVLVLGYLFNFTHEANNTYVVPVSISLTQSYFQEAMQVPGVDMIVVCSHIAPQFGPELQQIYKAIRAQHPLTPLVMLAGHSHVTYFANLDANAFTIESGKYFEVLGVIDFEIGSTGAMENLETQWVDTSVENFMSLSGTTKTNFDTPAGLATSQLIQYYSSILGLNITYGCSPSTYSPDVYYSDPNSLYQLYVEQVIPKTVFNTSDGNTPYFISNTQSLRYNLYAGPVTRNDIYTISPFNDTFVMYQGFPGKALAGLMQAIMNTTGIDNIDMNLNSRYCARVGDYNTPNWYTSSTPIVPSQVYDVVLASYDAETIYYTVRKLFGEESFAKYVNYPTENNGTGALQVFIEQFWPCKKE